MSQTSIVLPVGPTSYPKLFRPEHRSKKPKPNAKKAWSATWLYEQSAWADPDMQTLCVALVTAARERFGPDVSHEIRFNEKGESFVFRGDPANGDTIRFPFRADVKKKGYPEKYAFFLSAAKTEDPEKNIRPPQIIDMTGNAVTDPTKVYPGVMSRASVGVFSYDEEGNRGVSIGLNNVLLVADGPRLDNSLTPHDEFGIAKPTAAPEFAAPAGYGQPATPPPAYSPPAGYAPPAAPGPAYSPPAAAPVYAPPAAPAAPVAAADLSGFFNR